MPDAAHQPAQSTRPITELPNLARLKIKRAAHPPPAASVLLRRSARYLATVNVVLLDRDDCLLVVIDVQPAFYTGLDSEDQRRVDTVLARVRWLVAVAAAFKLPVIVTEEEPERQGSTHIPTAAALPEGTTPLVKPTFGLVGTPAILEAVRAVGRGTAVLVGFETDVCVVQSAIGLRAVGMRAVVVEDATFSPGEMHERGLQRLAGTGVERNHAKGVAYEWARTVRDGEVLVRVSDPPFRL